MTQEEKVEYKYVLINAIEKIGKSIAKMEEIIRANSFHTLNESPGKKKGMETDLAQCRNRLKHLTENLEALEKDVFGNCRKCGRPIPYKRLLLLPDTHTCGLC